MARKANEQKLDELRDAIIDNPEQRAGWLAGFLGRDNKSVNRDLPNLEECGDMLAEDENGRLHLVLAEIPSLSIEEIAERHLGEDDGPIRNARLPHPVEIQLGGERKSSRR